MEKISRKSFVKGALGLGLTGVLAGCASSASSTAARQLPLPARLHLPKRSSLRLQTLSAGMPSMTWWSWAWAQPVW